MCTHGLFNIPNKAYFCFTKQLIFVTYLFLLLTYLSLFLFYQTKLNILNVY